MIQETSKISYENIMQELGDRQLQVYNALRELKYATNNMIASYLKLPINSITPRVYELRKKELVTKSHVSWCPIKKTKCIYWKIW